MVSSRLKHTLIGAAVCGFVGLGTSIPALGLFAGPLFTFGGGLVGAATGAYLEGGDERDSIKLGLAVAVLGGVPSSIIGATLGTFLDMQLAQTGPNPSYAPTSSYVVLAVIGFTTGLILTGLGALIGGWLTAFLTRS